jgi:hypothetical protein
MEVEEVPLLVEAQVYAKKKLAERQELKLKG